MIIRQYAHTHTRCRARQSITPKIWIVYVLSHPFCTLYPDIPPETGRLTRNYHSYRGLMTPTDVLLVYTLLVHNPWLYLGSWDG